MGRFDNVLFANVLGILRPKYKISGVPMGRCRVDTCFTLTCTFYYRSLFFFGYSNLLLVYLWLKQRVNVLSVRMLENISLQGRSVTIRLTDKSVSIFKETIKKNIEKDKVVKLWNKNVQSNKSLAN